MSGLAPPGSLCLLAKLTSYPSEGCDGNSLALFNRCFPPSKRCSEATKRRQGGICWLLSSPFSTCRPPAFPDLQQNPRYLVKMTSFAQFLRRCLSVPLERESGRWDDEARGSSERPWQEVSAPCPFLVPGTSRLWTQGSRPRPLRSAVTVPSLSLPPCPSSRHRTWLRSRPP